MSRLRPGMQVANDTVRATTLIRSSATCLLWQGERLLDHSMVVIQEFPALDASDPNSKRRFVSWGRALKALQPGVLVAPALVFTKDDRFLAICPKSDIPSLKQVRTLRELTPHELRQVFEQILQKLHSLHRQSPPIFHGLVNTENVLMDGGSVLFAPLEYRLDSARQNPQMELQQDLEGCAQTILDANSGDPIQVGSPKELADKLKTWEDQGLAAAVECLLTRRLEKLSASPQILEFLQLVDRAAATENRGELEDAASLYDQAYNTTHSLLIEVPLARVKEKLRQSSKHKLPVPAPAVQEANAQPAQPLPATAPQPKSPERPINVQRAQYGEAPAVPPKAPTPAVPPALPSSPAAKKNGSKNRSKMLLISTLAILTIVVSIIYYVSGSTVREFDYLLARGSLVNSTGPNAYSVYMRAVQEKGANSSIVSELQSRVRGTLEAKSQEVFRTYYQESETGQMSWEEIVRLQDWLNQIQHSAESMAFLEYARGMNEMSKHNYRFAQQSLESALRLKPNWPLALNGLGRAYFNLHEFRQAEHYYLLASAADPSWKFPYSNLGNLYRDALGNFQEAEKQFQKAISLDPSRSSFHFNLATLYFTRGKQYWPQACSEFRQSLDTSSAKSLTPTEASLASQRMKKSCQGI